MTASRILPAPTTRRRFLQAGAALSGAVALGRPSVAAETKAAFSLPPLPYPTDALAPVIDERTMTIHHTKHHQTYLDKLNAAVAAEPSLAGKTVEQLLADLSAIPEAVRTAIRNHGGGHANHSLFWTVMRPPRDANAPAGPLATAIASTFGSFEKFQETFSAAAAGQFGSGWAWLVKGPSALEVMATPNQDSPISQGKKPILGIDVWEHAYYLNYQNRRPDYIKAWWKLVNWDDVAKRFANA
ncbi:MAG: superoxide dismutase [Planctomycetia bacterium]